MPYMKFEKDGQTYEVNINPDTNRPYGQAPLRQYTVMILNFIVDRIVQPSFYILYWLSIIVCIGALAMWGWRGTVELCRMM